MCLFCLDILKQTDLLFVFVNTKIYIIIFHTYGQQDVSVKYATAGNSTFNNFSFSLGSLLKDCCEDVVKLVNYCFY